jgi:adenine-specific DNA-methyltransferase
MNKIKELGQVFTKEIIVDKMLSLRKNNGSILEPSCGDGAFYNKITNCIGIEFDETVCPSSAMNIDFFDYSLDNKFDTIIGNPPYVAWKDIVKETKEKLPSISIFDNRSNLYLFFIHKCIEHLNPGGELIFITPREFMKNTSSMKMNEWIFESGTITYVDDLGDARIWDGALPNVAIWRFEKNNFCRDMIYNGQNRKFTYNSGQLNFLINEYSIPFNYYFYVKVGAVSGNDDLFEHDDGIDFVCSKTFKEGQLRKMIYNEKHPHLENNKDQLLSRKVKNFDENNWWQWGRNFFVSDAERIYVNGRVRSKTPFFQHECKAYDGSVLAIFAKFDYIDMKVVCEALNKVDWSELGFFINGRMTFTQNSLEKILLPKEHFKFLEKKALFDFS